MTLTGPLSLGEAKRLAESVDTILLRASRDADLETPVGALLRLDDGGPCYLLESVEGGERLGRYSFLGIGPRRTLEVRDGLARTITRPVTVDTYASDLPAATAPAPDPLRALREFVRPRRVAPLEGMPRFTGGAVGALAYDAVSSFEPVPLPARDPVSVPVAAYLETDLVLVFDHLTHTLSAIASLHTDAPDLEGRYRIAERAVFEALERTAHAVPAETAGGPRSAETGGSERGDRRAGGGPEASLGREQFESAVLAAKEAIAAGEAIQVVLARRQTLPLPRTAEARPLDGLALYRALRRVNPSPYLFFVRTEAYEVVGASPELLLRVEGDQVTTHPIAGTRPRGRDADEDVLIAEQLQRDPKERAEHVMLVDLGRNDLGRVARPGTVAVTRYMEVERYSHVLHLVSHVQARLRADCDALDALRAVFPAGTLSGAPKVRAMQLIAALEGERRGLYGGAVGYVGYDGNLDTAITIRSAVLKDGLAHLHTGAGIVAGSVPAREFEETEHKAAAMRHAIELATGASSGASRFAQARPAAATRADQPSPSEEPTGPREANASVPPAQAGLQSVEAADLDVAPELVARRRRGPRAGDAAGAQR